jgi:thiosulfate/3-mercaptopyruvate sulfurtransferase
MFKIVYIILLFFSVSYAQNKLPLISPQDAYKILNDKNTVFIDTEDNQTYVNEHIPGSVNIDVLAVQDVAIKNNKKQKCKYLPLCPKTAEKLLSENGISNNDKVIIYYPKNLPNKASYMWFLLYSMGHDENKLLILDGWSCKLEKREIAYLKSR